ncbi:MAG TPA: phosphoenolpyruvate carboxykinase (GTP) [Phycisphaerae bacterium]|nr:phosphoenolpyruvate carboxykinase (GTP) [Phycisphaerae bacterium]
MSGDVMTVLRANIDKTNLAKLTALANPAMHAFVADAITVCKPKNVFVVSDSADDVAAVRQMAIDHREETPLAMAGHTVHFDGPKDQGRDPGSTKYLLPEGVDLGARLNSVARSTGLAEIRGIMDGIMAARTMLVRFFCLGPTDSVFSIPCVQLTDSAYVGHSEDLLYRAGYEQFRKIGDSTGFFRVLHSAGPVGEDMTSTDVANRRVYVDIATDTVYSANTQYAGNTVGFKKLALRLAIRKADREGWLAEHMFVMGVKGPGGRKTYFCGAFPSGCGKTSTAMLPGETIVGDDLAYFRKVAGQFRAVNVEKGIFGIIRDVNDTDDPVIHDVLTRPGEVIFSNVLVTDGTPYWVGMGRDLPAEGVNYAGRWTAGMTDPEIGEEIEPSHWNARYTVSLDRLSNLDEALNDPAGVPVGGIIYGGRDSDTAVPVTESFDWVHGIVTIGASLESETTATVVGDAGVRKFDLMSILQFVAIPIGKYIDNNLTFVEGLASAPKVFGTNYFIKGEDGRYLNGMRDKHVWVKWAELRVHGDVDAIATPVGLIPRYEDLKRLFKEVLGKDYAKADYVEQFTIRIPENLAKIDRIEKIYREIKETPKAVLDTLAAQRERLVALRKEKGDYVAPTEL